jgi:cell pole-organizing protein PopZ
MEEILASIRKIIAEDGNAGRPVPPHLAVVRGADRSTRPGRPEPAADRSVPPDADMGADPEGLEPEAEEAAYAREGLLPDEPGDAAAAEDFEPRSGIDPSAGEEFVPNDEAEAYLDEDEEPEPEPIWNAPDYEPQATRHTAAEWAAGDLAAEAQPEDAGARGGGRGDNRRLLSPRSDEAVQSAFNQLADIILSEQTRTLEDIVKDMMQPMLRHWLDDNLPVLVERLIREEIERVSRGRR